LIKAIVELRGISPYSPGQHYDVPKLKGETLKEYEARTFRERLHINEANEVVMPQTALKNCLWDAAKYKSVQIPGKGKSTYTKHFESGIMVMEPMLLLANKQPIQKESVPPNWIFVPSDGMKGGGKRVEKCFPIVHQWGGSVVFYVLDEIIHKDVFRDTLETAGKFIGLGTFRPARGGFYGRFEICKFDWEMDDD